MTKILTIDDDYVLREAGGAVVALVNEVNFQPLIDASGVEGLVIGESVIIIHPKLVEILTAVELAAVVAHEEGHIALGHQQLKVSQGIQGISSDITLELEADRYAVQQTGNALALVSALQKLVRELIKSAPRKLQAAVWADIRKAGRIQALRSM